MTEIETAIKFFRERLKCATLKYGERQAIHMALNALEGQTIKCKDCKFNGHITDKHCFCYRLEAFGIVITMPLDGYCSSGEPMEVK